MRISPTLIAVAILLPPAQAQGSVSPSNPLRPLQQSILDIHNRERSAVGAPQLRWSFQLEKDAIGHAQQMARANRLIHAPREGRGIARENLSQGPLGWGPGQLMRNWLNEKRYFHGGIYPNVCTGGWSRCAHYTQIIWPGTTHVGCGMVVGRSSNWFVCRYSPGGNKDGKPLGAAPYRAVGKAQGPTESAKSRQLLGTPSQSRNRSNLETLCALSGKELKSLAAGLEQLKAQRAALAAEMGRVTRAINAAEAGVADYDPSLLERLLGTTQAPSNEQLIALSRRLKELMNEMRANQAETKAIVDKIKQIQAGSGPCRGGDRKQAEEERLRD